MKKPKAEPKVKFQKLKAKNQKSKAEGLANNSKLFYKK
jgi:hypothetical protein